MDINLLVLNVGNSRVALGVFSAGELKNVRRVSLDDRGNLPGIIKELWAEIEKSEEPAVAGASVNPPQMEWIEHLVREGTGQAIQWVGKEIDLPIEVLTDKPAETGADRILNVAAAYEQMGKACVVVDAGTAITIDCCNDQGHFLGGAIAPGVNMMLDALNKNTAKLPRIPRVQFQAPTDAFGKNTEQAILQGVYHGIRGMVKELVENYATALGNWPDLIATGGDAQTLFQGWELVHAVSPDLTLYGVALAYTNHQIKNED
jgi:type III pantothenate kinase